jgi:hypothetical protein
MAFPVLALLTVICARASDPDTLAPPPHGDAAAQLFARCQRSMLDSRCLAMPVGTQAAVQPGAAAETIVIAGVGRVDAKTYNSLVRTDSRMCDLVRVACGRRIEGTLCDVAAKLW